jgi:hypothetical protein
MQLWVSFEISWFANCDENPLGPWASIFDPWGYGYWMWKTVDMLYASRYPNKDDTIKQRTYLIMRSFCQEVSTARLKGTGIPIHSSHFFSSSFFFGGSWHGFAQDFGVKARELVTSKCKSWATRAGCRGWSYGYTAWSLNDKQPHTRNPGGIQYINVHDISSFCMGLIIRKDWHCRRGIRPRRWHFINEDCSVRENMNRNWKEPKCLGREMVGLFAFMFENGLRTMQNSCQSIYSMHMGVLYDIGIKKNMKNMVVSVTLYR